MTPVGDDLAKEISWLQHENLRALLEKSSPPHPWFPAYKYDCQNGQSECFYSALVPASSISDLLGDVSWDISIGGGVPGTIEYYDGHGGHEEKYFAHGNDEGVELLVIRRHFHQLRPDTLELSQEFSLFHNLYHEPSKKRYLHFDESGNETVAAKYGEKLFEIRTDLVLKFCAAKKMALALYADSHRQSLNSLGALRIQKTVEECSVDCLVYDWAINDYSDPCSKFQTIGSLLGKRYFIPDSMLIETGENERFQEFIIGANENGQPITYTCDPKQLANYFGANPGAPHFLTPVYFQPEVLTKYYSNPDKYSVEDGYLRCGGLWGLRMDNDHDDCVMVFLGDLGQTLSEKERAYWLSFNMPPDGRRMSQTTFRRGFLAEFADPSRPDLVFKHQYSRFNRAFRETYGWDFFLPLHDDDEHTLVSLRSLSSDSQAEFDSQLISLTKVLVDSLNEKEIVKGLTTLVQNDKGITKLEKFFSEKGLDGFSDHIKFLRVLQDLRSKSAAHRKGSSYEKLIRELQMEDEGQQKVFSNLLCAGCELIKYMRKNFTSDDWAQETSEQDAAD